MICCCVRNCKITSYERYFLDISINKSIASNSLKFRRFIGLVDEISHRQKSSRNLRKVPLVKLRRKFIKFRVRYIEEEYFHSCILGIQFKSPRTFLLILGIFGQKLAYLVKIDTFVQNLSIFFTKYDSYEWNSIFPHFQSMALKI